MRRSFSAATARSKRTLLFSSHSLSRGRADLTTENEANKSRKPAAEIPTETQNVAPKSLFRNIFHISPLKPKILREFPAKPVILLESRTKKSRHSSGLVTYKLIGNNRRSYPMKISYARTKSMNPRCTSVRVNFARILSPTCNPCAP